MSSRRAKKSSGRGGSKKPAPKTTAYQVVIIGSGAVGKSAVTVQFTNREFLETYDPTVEDRYSREIIVDGEPASLHILDTAGQAEVFTGLQDKWFREGEGFIFMYSVTDPESLEGLMKRRDRMLLAREGLDCPAVLVGNKTDLKRQRKVASEQGESLARIFDVPFFESSAKEYVNIDEMFAQLVREIRASRLRHGKPKEKRKKSHNPLYPVSAGERDKLKQSANEEAEKQCVIS